MLCNQVKTFSSWICKEHTHPVDSTTVQPRKEGFGLFFGMQFIRPIETPHTHTLTLTHSHLTHLTSLGRGNTPRSQCLAGWRTIGFRAHNIFYTFPIVTHHEGRGETTNVLTIARPENLVCSGGVLHSFTACRVALGLRSEVKLAQRGKEAALKEAFAGQQISAIQWPTAEKCSRTGLLTAGWEVVPLVHTSSELSLHSFHDTPMYSLFYI